MFVGFVTNVRYVCKTGKNLTRPVVATNFISVHRLGHLWLSQLIEFSLTGPFQCSWGPRGLMPSSWGRTHSMWRSSQKADICEVHNNNNNNIGNLQWVHLYYKCTYSSKDPRQGGEKTRTKNNTHLKIIQCQAISYYQFQSFWWYWCT